MAAAIALGERARGRTAPNPNVGCLIVKDEAVIGRGWTQDGGRPHAEKMALDEAGEAARGATVYVTLEPCAHVSERGPACANLLAEAKPAKVVIAAGDPDPRTNGLGIERLRGGRHPGRDRPLPGRGRGEHGRLLQPDPARAAVRDAEARHVDRRQDRHGLGREQVDHRRGSARPCPSRARAVRHDPGRPRHL